MHEASIFGGTGNDKRGEHMTAQKATPEERAAYMRRYQAEHREEINARQRAYYARHKEEINARSRARRKRKKLEQSGGTGRGE